MIDLVLHTNNIAAETTSGARVDLFDPPMCCSSGMCGPSVDPVLVDVNDMLQNLQEQGVNVQRHQMSSDPQAFLHNRDVYRLIQEQKMAALPITVVNGRVIKVGTYPSLSEIKNALDGGK